MSNDRFANTVLYLLRRSPKAGLTKLLKLLYFSDYCHYQEHLTTITGLEYVALERGPVIHNYEKKFKALESLGFIKMRRVPVVGHPDKPKQRFEGLADPAPDAFEGDELATMEDVLVRFGRKSGKELSAMTHEERGPWQLVWDRKAPGAVIPHVLFRWSDNFADKSDIETAKKRAKAQTARAASR